METFGDIIDRWKCHDDVAEDAGNKVDRNQVAVWKHRNSIPPEYWSRLVAGANARGIDGVTLDELAALAAKRKGLDDGSEAQAVTEDAA